MARIRSIKPEFPQSETIGRLSRDARLLFIQLWTIVDDEGRARAASRMLASLLYPYDDDASGLIEGWLGELEREQCLVRYDEDGTTYLEILNWLKHQRIDHKAASKIPPFREDSRILARVSETLAPDLGVGSRIGKDKDIHKPNGLCCPKPDKPVRTRNSYSKEFDEQFWKRYPTLKNADKGEAWKVWQRLSVPDREAACGGLAGYREFCRSDPTYRPLHPCRFLSKRRWEAYAQTAEHLAVVSSQVFVVKDSPQWDAWTRHLGKQKPTTQRNGQTGWYFEAEWPAREHAA